VETAIGATSEAMKNFSKIVLCGWLLLSGTLAYADPIPALANIPNNLNAEQKAKLTQQKQVLENELKNFQAAAGAFNAKPAKDQTDQDYDALQSQRSSYIQSATTFNQEVDSSVVDARNVPSGLPASVDRAITTAYVHAPSGVSDRVRKGFQAVMLNDWSVAKAWFEDALNHDPGNLNLKRLVQLSDYTTQRLSSQDSRNTPKQPDHRSAVQVPQDSDIELLFPGWEPPSVKPVYQSIKRVPDDADLVFLFPGLQDWTQEDRKQARLLNNLMFDEMLKATENDPVLLKIGNRLVN
jgi:hypothetical protein